MDLHKPTVSPSGRSFCDQYARDIDGMPFEFAAPASTTEFFLDAGATNLD
jgi:hypothetical protein